MVILKQIGYMSLSSKWEGFHDSENASQWRVRGYDLEIRVHRIVAAVTGPWSGPSGVSNSGRSK